MSTRVIIDSNVKDAKVTVNGRDVGTTPATVKMSNAVWEDPVISVEKKGYRTKTDTAEKEVKVGAGIVGLLLFWPALGWCYGPKAYQYFTLVQDEK